MVPEHPFYRERFGWRSEAYPQAMKIGRETVTLPLGPKLSDADVADVVGGVRRAVGA